jgi:hypothetical protein
MITRGQSARCDRDEVVGDELCCERHAQLHVLLGEGSFELVGVEELDKEDFGGDHGVAVADAVAETLRRRKVLTSPQKMGFNSPIRMECTRKGRAQLISLG